MSELGYHAQKLIDHIVTEPVMTDPTVDALREALGSINCERIGHHSPEHAVAAATALADAGYVVVRAEDVEHPRLLLAVEAAIANIQHNRIAAAIAGLRVARDLTRAALEAQP